MQDESRFSREEKEKAARLWTLTAFDVVPGAGIEPARLAAGDFESYGINPVYSFSLS